MRNNVIHIEYIIMRQSHGIYPHSNLQFNQITYLIKSKRIQNL